MKRLTAVCLLAFAAVLAACGAQPVTETAHPTPEPTMITDSKSLVLEATTALFGRRDAAAIDRHFAEAYLQHNPMFPSGKATLHKILEIPGLGYTRVRAVAEGDLVVTQSRYVGFGPRPMVAFDIFRTEGGKIVEHWDAMQAEEEKTVSGRTQLDGPTEARDLDRTAANKQLVESFFADVLYGHKMEMLTTYISAETYHQHNPGVGDGLAGFGKAMADLAKAGLSMVYSKTYRYVAEGDLVFTHSEGTFAGRHVVFADLFRVADGKIVEHWDAIQDVPEKTVSGLSMF
jgi:predicted SnoaL-like aldol condensation-catalyzing enzyme